MNFVKRSTLISTIIRRHFFTTTKLKAIKNPCPPDPTCEDIIRTIVRPQFRRLKENQKKFQVDDGLPVWLKGGVKDKILLQLTLILLVVGLGMSGQVMYELVMKDFA
ncbi:hypothetical protein HHI36_003446 [Cryptolaemus montrouzieri]|uniref:Uncharacterized protein n=1 Tax=Cryptolaemus montrouzieri TaxID=559131 RepID=A0ABD2PDG3_9CUCU